MDITIATNILFIVLSVFLLLVTAGFLVFMVFAILIAEKIYSFLNTIKNLKSKLWKIIK